MDDSVLSFRTLASGSSGNLAIVRSRRATLLMDLGIPTKKLLLQRLGEAGIVPGGVTAALVSHEHSDHVNWFGLQWCVAHRVPILGNRYALRFASSLYRAKSGHDVPDGLLQEVRAGSSYLVEDVEVTPFDVPHDVPTFGYVLRSGRGGLRRKVVVATDLGCARPELLPWFTDADAVILEANYDVEMLRRSPRHPLDKARVASDHGHLSNVQSGRFLKEIWEASRTLPKATLLAHLSRDHNRPELAENTVRYEAGPAGGRVPVHTAPAFEPGPEILL